MSNNFEIKKINEVNIKKINLPKIDVDNIKGYDMIPELYANIYICAKKKSGKTTVIYNILKNSVNKNTHVYFFVSTINRDPSYNQMIEWLDKKNIKHDDYMSIYDNGEDILEKIINENLQKSNIEEEKTKEKIDKKEVNFFTVIKTDQHSSSKAETSEQNINDDYSIKVKVKKDNWITPDLFFIFDDLSAEIRNSVSLRRLLKMNRHIKSKVIVSSQFLTDLSPDSRMQINIWILFPGHSFEKIKNIYESSDPSISLDLFIKIYKYATSEKYNFLMIDNSNGEYRKNFNELIITNDE